MSPVLTMRRTFGHASAFARRPARSRLATPIAVGVLLTVLSGVELQGRTHGQESPPTPVAGHKEVALPSRATGTFEVKLTPQPMASGLESESLSRMSIDKQWQGDLTGTSQGEMLAARTQVPESAGYVAIERVSGTLAGRRGTFVLQHSGTMTRGAPGLLITVVPDSGTGELDGLVGRLMITIAEGRHSYEFEYSLPPAS